MRLGGRREPGNEARLKCKVDSLREAWGRGYTYLAQMFNVNSLILVTVAWELHFKKA